MTSNQWLNSSFISVKKNFQILVTCKKSFYIWHSFNELMSFSKGQSLSLAFFMHFMGDIFGTQILDFDTSVL